MNYIELHIGDYSAATFHLTPLEDGIYWRLLRVYYRDEKVLPADTTQVERMAGARTADEKAAVQTILAEFFTLQADGWHQARCDAELVRYRERMVEADARRENEAERQRRHREERARLFEQLRDADVVLPFDTPTSQLRDELSRVTSRRQTADATATHTPDTRHQAPVKERGRAKAARRCPTDFTVSDAMREWAVENAPDVDVDLATAKFADHTFARSISDWPAAWRNWLRNDQERAAARPAAAVQRETFRERDERLAREKWEQITGRRRPGAKAVIDITPTDEPPFLELEQ